MLQYRSLRPPPTDPFERKARIRWLQAHTVWTHPASLVLQKGDTLFDVFYGEDENLPHDLSDEGEVVRHFRAGGLDECLRIEFVHVNPETEMIEDDDSLNTAFRVWLESGPWFDRAKEEEPPEEGWQDYNRWMASHDVNLDCGAPTLEEALLHLANLVELHYNEDGTDKEEIQQCDLTRVGEERYVTGCTPDEEGYCIKCDFFVKERER